MQFEHADINPAPEIDSWEQRNRHFSRLIKEARLGSLEAFEELYNCSVRWLLARIRRMVDDGQAEDIVAEVYLQVWRSLGSYDESRAPPAVWLAMIARSRALDHLRREKRRACESTSEMEDAGETGHSDGPEQLLTRAQDARLVQLSIANLNDEERTVLGLAYFQDCTQQEISSQTGWRLARVKTLMARAQHKLRAHFSMGVTTAPATVVSTSVAATVASTASLSAASPASLPAASASALSVQASV